LESERQIVATNNSTNPSDQQATGTAGAVGNDAGLVAAIAAAPTDATNPGRAGVRVLSAVTRVTSSSEPSPENQMGSGRPA